MINALHEQVSRVFLIYYSRERSKQRQRNKNDPIKTPGNSGVDDNLKVVAFVRLIYKMPLRSRYTYEVVMRQLKFHVTTCCAGFDCHRACNI